MSLNLSKRDQVAFPLEGPASGSPINIKRHPRTLKHQGPNRQSDEYESERRQQSSESIIQNTESGAEGYDKSHDEPEKTPLSAPPVAQDAILDGFQQGEAGEMRRKSSLN